MKYIKHSQQSKIKSINQQPLPTTNPFPDILFDGVFFSFLDLTILFDILYEGR